MPPRNPKELLAYHSEHTFLHRLESLEREIHRLKHRTPGGPGDVFNRPFNFNFPLSQNVWIATPETGIQPIIDEAGSVADEDNPQNVWGMAGVYDENIIGGSYVSVFFMDGALLKPTGGTVAFEAGDNSTYYNLRIFYEIESASEIIGFKIGSLYGWDSDPPFPVLMGARIWVHVIGTNVDAAALKNSVAGATIIDSQFYVQDLTGGIGREVYNISTSGRLFLKNCRSLSQIDTSRWEQNGAGGTLQVENCTAPTASLINTAGTINATPNCVFKDTSGVITQLEELVPPPGGSPTSEALTIAAGVITLTKTNMIYLVEVDTEGGAATDNLDTINGGTKGQVIVMKTVNNARDVVLRDGVGNIFLAASANKTLTSVQDTASLVFDGTNWLQVGFENN